MKIVFFSPVAWQGLRQRHQSLATALAQKGFSVLFVNPLVSPGFSYQEQSISTNLTVLTVYLPFRATGWRGLQSIACRLTTLLLKKYLTQPWQKIWCWVADPSLFRVTHLPWSKVLYDRCDHHGMFPGQRLNTWQFYENQIYKKSNVIFVSSETLAIEPRKAGHTKVHLLGNAGRDSFEHNFVTQVLASTNPLPSRANPKSDTLRLISSGAHFEWVDFKWLNAFLTSPKVELHIAGAGRGEVFHQLCQHPQVVWHGQLNDKRLQLLLDSCQVGLVPFKQLQLTYAVDPIKVYEFAQRGLTVWGTPCSTLQTHPFVTDTFTVAEVSNKVKAYLKAIHEPPTLPEGSPSVPTWTNRIDEALRLILSQKAGTS